MSASRTGYHEEVTIERMSKPTVESRGSRSTAGGAQERMQDRGMHLFEKANLELCEFAQTEWVPLPKPLVVDSGAGETVIPNDCLPQHPTKASVGSNSDDYYTTADGTKVYNEGEKRLDV